MAERSNADQRKRSLPKRTCPVPQSASARESCFPPTRPYRRYKESWNASKNPSALAVGSLSGLPLRGKNLIISLQLLEKMEPESGKRLPTDSYGV